MINIFKNILKQEKQKELKGKKKWNKKYLEGKKDIEK